MTTKINKAPVFYGYRVCVFDHIEHNGEFVWNNTRYVTVMAKSEDEAKALVKLRHTECRVSPDLLIRTDEFIHDVEELGVARYRIEVVFDREE